MGGVAIATLGFCKARSPARVTKKTMLLSREIGVEIIIGQSTKMNILSPPTTVEGMFHFGLEESLILLGEAPIQILDLIQAPFKKLVIVAMTEARFKKISQSLSRAHPVVGLAYNLAVLKPQTEKKPHRC